jgi:hypothetical protein
MPKKSKEHYSHGSNEVLHVITVVFNPGGFERRYKLHQDFVQHVEMFDPRVRVYTVELAIGNQGFQVTDRLNRRHLQLRTDCPMWYKENLVNIAVGELLPYNWKYVAWIDADIIFQNPDWVDDTVEALQTFDIIQPFEMAVDLGKRDNPISSWTSFGSYNVEKGTVGPGLTPYDEEDPGPHPSKVTPGFAWACTRNAWERMGGLLDRCIVGSGDYHMAMALINRVQDTFHSTKLTGYNKFLLRWQKRVEGLKLGYAPGIILHRWHGDRKNRKYHERRGIIERHHFDPDKHINYGDSGLMLLAKEVGDMVEDFFAYFRGRKEDN